MKTKSIAVVATVAVVAAVLFGACRAAQGPAHPDPRVPPAASAPATPPGISPTAAGTAVPEGPHPFTHLQFNEGPDRFQFAIVTDRTGGHRAGVFEDAIRKLNLLQPA